MCLYRKTYAEINLSNIKNNVKKIINRYNNYKYYIGVVKSDCYGHGIKAINSVIDGGCNYLAVALLEEAIAIREFNKKIPILCLGNINPKYLKLCIDKNITITVNSLEYVNLITSNINNLKVHIKLNTGMNRLGISKISELKEVIRILKEKGSTIEGIYTHIYDALSTENTLNQIKKFENLLYSIDYENIPIIHFQASDALTNYLKPNYINGCRLGIIIYGFSNDTNLQLESTFKLYSQVIQINELNSNETVGYNGIYKAKHSEKIGVVSIGYDDGIIRKNTGRNVYINNREYKIVGNICMDMLFVSIDDNVKLYDKVLLLKDIEHIKKVSKYLETIPYEVLCIIGKRVPRIYINE